MSSEYYLLTLRAFIDKIKTNTPSIELYEFAIEVESELDARYKDQYLGGV